MIFLSQVLLCPVEERGGGLKVGFNRNVNVKDRDMDRGEVF